MNNLIISVNISKCVFCLSFIYIFKIYVTDKICCNHNRQNPVYRLPKQINESIINDSENSASLYLSEEYCDSYNRTYKKQDNPFGLIASLKNHAV